VNPERLSGVGITGEFRRGGPLGTIIEQLKRIEDKHVRLILRQDTIYVTPLGPGG
jgi:hypothetical protein